MDGVAGYSDTDKPDGIYRYRERDRRYRGKSADVKTEAGGNAYGISVGGSGTR